MRRFRWLILGCSLLAGHALATASTPLFQSGDTLDITLQAPFREIDRKRERDREYPGKLVYSGPAGAPVTLDANFEVRGNYRLRPDVCRYAQLWVDLRRKQLPDTLFAGQDRLKLVVQCQPSERYGDLILKEYLAYRFFNRLSELSLTARPLRVTYQATDDDSATRTQPALFIEHLKTLGKHNGLQPVKAASVPLSKLDPRQSTLVALFMFMIGNTDFSVAAGPKDGSCCHNTKLLEDAGRYFPVPYDFDGSGFVDASYAGQPSPSLGIRNNRQRLFRGYCIHNAEVAAVLPVFSAARDDILALVDNAPFSSASTRKSARGYLEDFFAIIADPEDVSDDILDDCRK